MFRPGCRRRPRPAPRSGPALRPRPAPPPRLRAELRVGGRGLAAGRCSDRTAPLLKPRNFRARLPVPRNTAKSCSNEAPQTPVWAVIAAFGGPENKSPGPVHERGVPGAPRGLPPSPFISLLAFTRCSQGLGLSHIKVTLRVGKEESESWVNWKSPSCPSQFSLPGGCKEHISIPPAVCPCFSSPRRGGRFLLIGRKRPLETKQQCLVIRV